MNKKTLLFHLSEAAEQLRCTIEELKNDAEFDEEALRVEMGHAYHHLNSAWNGRNCTDEEHQKAQHFDEWRKFPKDSELFL